jgi:foldase protein PrsA
MSYLQRLAACLAAAAFAGGLAACSNAPTGSGDAIADVGGTKITKGELDSKLEGGPAGKQALTQLIQGALIEQYAKEHDIVVTDTEVQKKLDETKVHYPTGQFEQILKQQGLTADDVNRLLRHDLILEKAVGKDVKVGDADVKAYFEKNHAAYDKPEQVRARHILVPDEKTADTVYDKLKAGGKFEDLAKQYSTDPSTKEKGGELGFFGRHQMVPTFEQAAFSQPLHEIGKPVKSPFGYHVIEVEEHKDAQTASLASVHDDIKKQLVQQQEAQQVPAFLEGLRAKAKVAIYDDRLKDAMPSPLAPPPATPSPAPSSAATSAASTSAAATANPAVKASPAPAATK